MNISLSTFAPDNSCELVSRDGLGSPVPRQPAHLHTQAESSAYLRDSSRAPRRRPFFYLNRHTPSGQSRGNRETQLRTRWRSLPRVRRHSASSPQGSSKRVLPLQVTVDRLICASLSHTLYYWYEVDRLQYLLLVYV